MSDLESLPSEESAKLCRNCGEPLKGPYCAACGQRESDLRRPLRELITEWLGVVISFDSRLARTIGPLVARPGLLTLEYLAGRRVRYVHPLKLYLVISLVFFVGLAFAGYSLVKAGDREDAHVIALDFGETEIGGPGSESAGDGEESAGEAAEPSADVSNGNPSWLAWLVELAEVHEEDPGRLDRLFIDRLAKSIFILVPVFALFLKPLFRRRRLVYVEHLICSLHLHSFAFLALLAGLAVNVVLGNPQGAGTPLSQIAILVYTFMALRRVYGDGRIRTAAKMFALSFAYLIALVFTMLLTLFLTWLTI